jgi:proteasome activator subunit 4
MTCTYLLIRLKILWHVPNAAEIDFALRILHELVEPTLEALEKLLDTSGSKVWKLRDILVSNFTVGTGIARDATWRNDFCRYVKKP